MLANHQEGESWNEYVDSGVKYICRLDNFPYSELSEVDYEHHHVRDKNKRFRGIPVGETSGLGIGEGGHHLLLNDEFDNVGLFIAAISYLTYASA